MDDERRPLFEACYLGDIKEVRRLVAAGAKINEHDQAGDSPLRIAIKERNAPLVRALIELGADPYAINYPRCINRTNAIELAVKEGFVAGLRIILDEKGFKLRMATRQKKPEMILFHAMEGKFDNILMLRYLVREKNLDPRKAVFPHGYTLLHAAEKERSSAGCVEYLLMKGLSPNAAYKPKPDGGDSDMADGTELTEEEPPEEKEEAAAADEDDDEWEDEEEEPDYERQFDGLPLTMAAYRGGWDHVVLYLRYGAELLKKNHAGRKAMEAVTNVDDPGYAELEESYRRIVDILTRAASSDSKPPETRPPLHRACATGNINQARAMLAAGANPDQVDGWNWTALSNAMWARDLDTVKLLIEHRADPYGLDHYTPEYASIPVAKAAQAGFVEALRYLVDEKGFKLWPAKDRPAEDLLFYAGNVRVLRYLVEEKGLKPGKALRADGTDLLLAYEQAKKPLACIAYLLENKYDRVDPNREIVPRTRDGEIIPPDTDENDGYEIQGRPLAEVAQEYNGLPAVRAAFNGNADLLALYLRNRANPLQWNSNGKTALDAAEVPDNMAASRLRKLIARATRELMRGPL